MAKLKPFKLDLITTLKDDKGANEINTNNIFIPSTNTFDPHGLFSNEIFDIIGSEGRAKVLGYITLPLSVFHPLIYTNFIGLKRNLHTAIANKETRVKLSPDKTEFIEDDNGSYGLNFLIQSFPKMSFKQSGEQNSKDLSKEFLTKYQKNYLIDKLIVIPPALREYRVDEDTGLASKDEINNLYSKIISISGLISNINVNEKYLEQYDEIRMKLQTTVVDIYNYIFTLLNGKQKFIEGNWSKRAVQYGTRNVITLSTHNARDLREDKAVVTINHTKIGMYQYLKSIEPVVMHELQNRFISKIMSDTQARTELVNPKTLKYETVELSIKIREKWLTSKGINKIIGSLKNKEYLPLPIKLDTHYLLLVYDDGEAVKIIWNNSELEGVNKDFVRPITYGELFYLAVYETAYKYRGLLTRYPITGLGSIYPCKLYLVTTVIGRKLKYIDDTGNEDILYEYPKLDEEWVRSLSPSLIRLDRLGGDHDGDSIRGAIIGKVDGEVTYLNMKDFPREELIETKDNIEYYSVPDNVEVLTIWNGKEKWVHPQSYSIHKNLEMINVHTTNGDNIFISNDHSLVTVDENLKYVRSPAKLGMSIPRVNKGARWYYPSDKVRTSITVNRYSNRDDIKQEFKLTYKFGYAIGAIIARGTPLSNYRSIDGIVSEGQFAYISTLLGYYGYCSRSWCETKDGVISDPCWVCWPFFSLFKDCGIGNEDKPLPEGILGGPEPYVDSPTKHLPDWWVNTTSRFKRGLLVGLLDFGNTYMQDFPEECYIDTYSERLAYEIVALANNLEISAKVEYYNYKTPKYRVVFNKATLHRLTSIGKLLRNDIRKIKFPNRNRVPLPDYTPNIPDKQLERLMNYIRETGETKYLNDLYVARVRSLKYGLTYLKRDVAIKICKTYGKFISNDNWWLKFKKMVNNRHIYWDIIKTFSKVPSMTEAYDVTVPPYCTFVTHNGIVAYDTCSLNVVMTEEALEEIDKYLDSVDGYVSVDNAIISPVITAVSKSVIAYMME